MTFRTFLKQLAISPSRLALKRQLAGNKKPPKKKKNEDDCYAVNACTNAAFEEI
jgi:hypothetical protein